MYVVFNAFMKNILFIFEPKMIICLTKCVIKFFMWCSMGGDHLNNDLTWVKMITEWFCFNGDKLWQNYQNNVILEKNYRRQ
jgi:hypothetical protein